MSAEEIDGGRAQAHDGCVMDIPGGKRQILHVLHAFYLWHAPVYSTTIVVSTYL